MPEMYARRRTLYACILPGPRQARLKKKSSHPQELSPLEKGLRFRRTQTVVRRKPNTHLDHQLKDIWIHMMPSYSLRDYGTILSAHLSFRSSTRLVLRAPSAARLGDLICVLAGAGTPFVFRPVVRSQAGARYSVAGIEFVSDMVDGEIIREVEEATRESRDLTFGQGHSQLPLVGHG